MPFALDGMASSKHTSMGTGSCRQIFNLEIPSLGPSTLAPICLIATDFSLSHIFSAFFVSPKSFPDCPANPPAIAFTSLLAYVFICLYTNKLWIFSNKAQNSASWRWHPFQYNSLHCWALFWEKSLPFSFDLISNHRSHLHDIKLKVYLSKLSSR